MNLYDHQAKIVAEDPKQTGLFLGTGSGKTRIALMLTRGKTLVICPKTQREDKNWEREAIEIRKQSLQTQEEIRIDLTVISKEEFRRDHQSLPKFDTVIVDEAHTCLGVTPNTRQRKKVTIPRASQLFEALDWYVQTHKPARLYLCTATIMKSPMTVWAAAHLFGKAWNFYDFRRDFYTKLPMPGREVYSPKKTAEVKQKLAELVKSLGYVGRLEDYFDVPDQTYRTIHIDLKKAQIDRLKSIALEFPDPIVRLTKRHQIENGSLKADEFNDQELFDNGKQEKLLELAMEFPRMVVFAKYSAQIVQLGSALAGAGYKVLTMTGDTKDRGGVIAEANSSDECIFVVQAQISAGWELPEYPVMVFASRTYSFVDYDQAIGRIQRANNIKKNLYINLVVKGGVDEAVDKALADKTDFNEILYAKTI